jgi:GNAT superfamily N-acetyltransferase
MVQGIRPGLLSDVRALIRMHAACSDETVLRRYLAPLPVLTPRFASRLLAPPGGFSIVAERRGELAGIVTVAPESSQAADAGALVVDGWQRQGIGTQLLIAAAREAGRRFQELSLTTHPGNRAVLPTVHAAGLRARVRQRDGLVQIAVPLVGVAPPDGTRLALAWGEC